MKILVFDNYDSFTYNLVQIVEEITGILPDVFRNDQIDLESIDAYDKIILSPGPGLPSESGIIMPLLKKYASTKDILGVCLGHQAIGECFGAKLYNLERVMHGVATPTQVIHEDLLFEGIPEKFNTGRYHSWAVESENFPKELKVTAIDEKGVIMALRHKTFKIRGVQFHPESILTENGVRLMKNWLDS
jgi:anthranilate synthase component 2